MCCSRRSTRWFFGADNTFVIQSGDFFWDDITFVIQSGDLFFWADITFVIQSCAFCFGLTLDSTFNVVIFCPTLDVQGGDSFWQTFSVRRGDFIVYSQHATFNVVPFFLHTIRR